MGSTPAEATLRLVGGATFFDGSLPLSASWPFAVFTASEDGLSIGWRWGRDETKRARFGWADLVSLQLSRNTVSWYDRQMFLHRFVYLSDDSMEVLIGLLDRHAVPYRIVSQTWSRHFTLT